jgi:hypothetical protein
MDKKNDGWLGQINSSAIKTLQYRKDDPETALQHARKAAEAICRDVYEREYRKTSRGLRFGELIHALSREKPILPNLVMYSLRNIQNFGGINAHENMKEYVKPVLDFFPAIIKWYFEEYRMSNIPDQIKIWCKAEEEITQVKTKANGGGEFTGFPPSTEAKPVIPIPPTIDQKHHIGFRFERAGSSQSEEYKGVRIKLGLPESWYEIHSLENHPLPRSKFFFYPDPPYLVHMNDTGEVTAIWVVYIPRLSDELDDWTPNQVGNGRDLLGQEGKLGFGILTSITLTGDSTVIPTIDSIEGGGVRLLEDISPQVTSGYDANGKPITIVTRWIISSQPFR